MGHDLAPFLAFDWTAVTVAIIAATASCLNTLGVAYLWTHLRTPSGTKIGKQVEDAQHAAIANYHLLYRIAKEVGVESPEESPRANENASVDDAA